MSFFNTTCTLTAKSVGVSASGFASPTVAVGVTTYRCMPDVTSDESMESGKESPVIRGQIYFPPGVPVTAESVINLTSGVHSGRSFQVQGTPTDEVGEGTHLVCEVLSRLDGLI